MAWWLLSVIPSVAAGLDCGSVLTRDTRLEADLLCPDSFTGVALTIAAPGIILDGGGHTVRVSAGTAVSVQAHDITVTDLVLSGAARGIVARNADKLTVVHNDLSQIHSGWALSLEEGDEPFIADNDFDGAVNGLRLVAVSGLQLENNTFSRGRRAISVEKSQGLLLEGLMLDGFSGTALTLRDCHRCEVTGSSFVGSGQAISVLDSDGVWLAGNDLRESARGVSLVDSDGVSMDGSNALTGITGAVVEISGGSAHLDGLVTTTGDIVASHSELRVTNHRSCGAGLWLHEVEASLDGALASVTQLGGSVYRSAGGFPDQDGDELPDACDPCQDPDHDGRCPGEDLCLGILQTDKDKDGFCLDLDCDDQVASIHPSAAELSCNDIDDDCDPITEDRPDSDGDGIAVCNDCDDSDPLRFPGAPERCDGQDDDCNAQVDDGLPFDAWFADTDHDGYGGAWPAFTCDGAPEGHVSNHADCDDKQATVHPGAQEILRNGVDDDCNRMTSDAEPGTVWID